MILDDIIAHKRVEVAAAREKVPLAELVARLGDQPAPRGFASALRARSATGPAVIAEVKKGSPSKGIIRADFHPVEIARSYERGGAACLSVLTDKRFFYGDLEFLPRVAEAVEIPLLRKDFVIDPYQLVEARANRADAILLIAAALDDASMKDLAGRAEELGLDILFEVHDEEELERVLPLRPDLLGINNRDLRTFVTDLSVTERLMRRIPAGPLVVAESGISSRKDVLRLRQAGCGAFLIGESLMRQEDVEGALRDLIEDGK